MHRYNAWLALLLAFSAVFVAIETLSTCKGFKPGTNPRTPMKLQFGMQDSKDGISTPYSASVADSYSNYDMAVEMEGRTSFADNIFDFSINNGHVMGGKNWTSYFSDRPPIPTASFNCLNEYSGMWGPSYPDAKYLDLDIRAQYDNLEVYVQYSAPPKTSYIRAILFVQNVGTTPERVRVNGVWYTDVFAADVSPISNEGRYFAMWPWFNGDLGYSGNNPSASYNVTMPAALHVRGPKARDNVTIAWDMDESVIAPSYYTELAPGQQMALMFVATMGTNKSVMLKNAAEIDAEPSYLFHDLTPDQLSLIRNWGGCQVVLAPYVSVQISSNECSTGPTSDFTVTVQTSRSDFTAEFTHRIVSTSGKELVPAQFSNVLAVPNGVGQMQYQLWYKECLIKTIDIDACPKTSNDAVLPAHTVYNNKAAKRSTSDSNSFSSGVSGSICIGFSAGDTTDTFVLSWKFGLEDGQGQYAYSATLTTDWYSNYDLFVQQDSRKYNINAHNYWINGIPITGAISTNDTDAPIPTANFTCDDMHSGLWGPAYPDMMERDTYVRGKFDNLEVYVHYSAPSTSSYIRSIIYIKNIGNHAERVNLFGDWKSYHYNADVSPLNGGRYYTPYPWQNRDKGLDHSVEEDFSKEIVTSVHGSGPKGRDAKNSKLYTDRESYITGPTYYTTLGAGREMALMYITSFGLNKSLALQNAKEIDAEPYYIFHQLNADQLSLIRNWGACEAAIAPYVTILINQDGCVKGPTSDFTVSVQSSRKDFTASFTHVVVSLDTGNDVVPAQFSTVLAVPNGIGPVKHQLWYRECLVKETNFYSC